MTASLTGYRGKAKRFEQTVYNCHPMSAGRTRRNAYSLISTNRPFANASLCSLLCQGDAVPLVHP
ncbi:MAG: hypothetical protein NC247_11525, partial [Ruminococcus flavefaciens]|nr:hypothetical protein [Ruminococcus flavefaciens]